MGEEVLIRRMLRRTDVANMDDLVWGCVLMQIVADKDPLINDTLKNHPFYKWAFSWTHGLLAVIQRAYENTLNPHLHIQTQEDIQILWEDLGGGTRFFPFPASTQRQQLQLDMGPHGNVCEMMNKVIRVMDEPWYNKAFLDKPLSHPSWNESSVNKTQKAHNKTPDDDKTLTQLNPVVQPPQVQLPQVQPPQVQLPQSESKSSVVTPVDSSATPSSAREANAKESIITVLNSQTETSKNQKKEPMIKDGEISELAGEEKVRSYPAYLIIKELTAKERVVVLKLSCPKKWIKCKNPLNLILMLDSTFILRLPFKRANSKDEKTLIRQNSSYLHAANLHMPHFQICSKPICFNAIRRICVWTQHMRQNPSRPMTRTRTQPGFSSYFPIARDESWLLEIEFASSLHAETFAMKGSYAVSTIPEDPIISNQSRKKFSLVMYHQKQTFNAPETKDSTNYLFKEQMVYVREIKLTKRRSAANAPQSPNKRMKIDKTEVAVDVQADAKISQDL